MCAWAPVLAVAGALVTGLMGSKSESSAPAAPTIETYTPPDTTALDVTAPPAPTAAPTFGQKSAEDLQKDAAADVAKKNKKGRAALRIDRVEPATGLSGGGQVASGAVVPKG